MNDQANWADLLQEADNAESGEAVLAVLGRLDSYDEDMRGRVLAAGLDRLADLGYAGFEDALIEQCLTQTEFAGHVARDRLARWLEEGAPERRDKVVRRLAAEMNGGSPQRCQGALWSAVRIGYRDDALVEALVRLVEAPPEEPVRIAALWALVWLGYPDTGFIEGRIDRVLRSEGDTPELALRCVRKLAPRGLLPELKELFQRLASSDSEETARRRRIINVLYALAAIADEHLDAAARVWDTILPHADAVHGILAFVGGIVDRIDDPRVVDYFLHRLTPVDPRECENRGRVSPHFHPYLKLGSLTLPKQLDGLHGSLSRAGPRQREDALEALHLDATVDTQNRSVGQTGLSLIKEHSWDVILRLDLSETNCWLVEALDETGPFAAGDICRLTGYLRVSGAVPKLREWVRRDAWEQEDGLPIGLGVAALEALGNIGTPEAFEALMESRVSFAARYPDRSVPETTPRNYGTAVAAAVLTMGDAAPLVSRLEIGPENENARPWIACAAALEAVALAAPELAESHRGRIFALLGREDCQSQEYLRILVSAVGFLDREEAATDQLLQFARQADAQLAIEAIEALAHWEVLHRYDDLLDRIGLKRSAGRTWRAGRHLDHREAHIAGLLYRAAPEAFADLLASIIVKGSYQQAIQVVRQIGRDADTADVVDALVARAKSANHASQSEGDVLRALLEAAPQRFLQEFGHAATRAWHPSGREVVVVCYHDAGKRAQNGAVRRRAVKALASFLDDPAYIVRRAAGRALADMDASRLESEIARLSASPDPHLRRNGVDASAWVPEDAFFADVMSWARTDREALVRKTAEEAMRDRRRNRLAQEYLEALLAAPDNHLLSAWHYGQALRDLGDDEVLRRIRTAREDLTVRPNKRALLADLHKEIERGWKKLQGDREKRLSE